MYTFEYLKQKVDNARVFERYVCEDKTSCAFLKSIATSGGLEAQKTIFLQNNILLNVFVIWWIEFIEEKNEFIFNVDFFNKNNEYVSIEQVQSMYNMVYNMALTYKKQTPFVWINTIMSEHVLTYQSNNPFGLLMKKFLPVIYKI